MLLLSVGAGILGCWIVLRGLAFYSHAVGSAAFPGLVLADGLGFAAPLGALGAAARIRARCRRARRPRAPRPRRHDGARPRRDAGARRDPRKRRVRDGRQRGDAAVRQPAAGRAARPRAGRRWRARARSRRPLTLGRDVARDGLRPRRRTRARGARRGCTTGCCWPWWRSWSSPRCPRSARCSWRRWSSCPPRPCASGPTAWRPWQAITVALVAAEGIAGLALSVELNAPPGATIAALSGAVFAVSAAVARLRARGAPDHGRAWRLGAALVLALGACGERRRLRGPAWSRPRHRSPTGPGRSRATGSRASASEAEHRPARVRAAPRRRGGARATPT